MDLAFTEEQNMLQASARSFLKKECPPSLLKDLREDEKGYPRQLWDRMIELGWLGVMIPEEYGGIGGDFLDLCIILECMGEGQVTVDGRRILQPFNPWVPRSRRTNSCQNWSVVS